MMGRHITSFLAYKQGKIEIYKKKKALPPLQQLTELFPLFILSWLTFFQQPFLFTFQIIDLQTTQLFTKRMSCLEEQKSGYIKYIRSMSVNIPNALQQFFSPLIKDSAAQQLLIEQLPWTSFLCLCYSKYSKRN